MNDFWKRTLAALFTLGVVAFLAVTVYKNTEEGATHPFKLGLDLAGGAHLVYEADTSGAAPEDVDELMQVLRAVIERRVNIFGVSEPLVQVEESSIVTGEVSHRLVVELPGVADVEEAVRQIGETPLLEFKLVNQEAMAAQQFAEQASASSSGVVVGNVQVNGATTSEPYINTELSGRYLESAKLEFVGQNQQGGVAGTPVVSIAFNDEGAKLFEQITSDNVGQQLAIFLDGELLSAPNINEPIAGGQAVISGGFAPEEAKALAENLNFGALPLPITLAHTQTVDATLGSAVLGDGVKAGMAGIVLVIIFMVLWYRLPGLIAGFGLFFYVVATLALFQCIPVTLTAAGLAGFILSLGMAVDANVLVFERMKEELRRGESTRNAARIGFSRAWGAIRDGNVTSLLTAVILFWLGTSVVKGFALVFGLGVIVSMVSALMVTRTLLLWLPDIKADDKKAWFFRNGLKK